MHNPPGFYPFWFWNDRLAADEIRWQVGQMAAQGLRGFFIHPRQGMGQPYLSDAFFDMVATALDAAERHGLLVHLYDEYPYPSGVAGGEVTEGNPHFQATALVQRTFDLDVGPVRQALSRGHVLSCIAYPLVDGIPCWDRGIDMRSSVGMVLVDESYNVAGLTPYNQKRYFASNPTPVLETELTGPHRLYVSVQTHVTMHKYWGYYTDVLNPEAVQHYIELTHERYYARFGDKFGTTIRSIFVDETAPHWSRLVPAAFEKTYGYDLVALLPALRETAHPQHRQLLADFNALLYDMFLKSYDRPMAAWCQQHGIAYSGEKHAMRLSQLRHMHIPGCDPGHTKAGAKELDILVGDIRRSAKATASAAYFYDKEGALDECYHSLGWSGTMQDAKLIAEMLILMGIRYLVPHGFFYSTHALKKHDAPPTFFFQMPYWPLWHQLSRRIESLYNYFEGTYIDAEILLIDHATVLPTREDIASDGRLRSALLHNQFDFHIVDTDILESAEIRGDTAHIKDIAARVVICPPGRVIEDPLAKWLSTFEQSGGLVLRMQQNDSTDDLLAQVRARVQPRLSFACQQAVDALQLVTRRDARRTLYFLVNSGGDTIDLRLAQPVRELAIDNDTPLHLRGDICTLAPFDSVLLERTMAIAPTAPPRVAIPMDGTWTVTPHQANALRLYDWHMALLDEEGSTVHQATVPAVPIANQLDHGRFSFAPQLAMRFGTMPLVHIPKLRVRYETHVVCDYDGTVELLIEPGTLIDAWSLTINETKTFIAADFQPSTAHIRGSLSVDITPYLRAGDNMLRIELTTDRLDGGLRNPLYLFGNFGVEVASPRLYKRVEQGHFETYESNGLPFYAGVVEYEKTFELEAVPEGERALIELAFDQPFLEACQVSINDAPWRSLPWSPYAYEGPTNVLQPGINRLRVRVYTSLIRAFEGQRFNHELHTQEEIT